MLVIFESRDYLRSDIVHAPIHEHEYRVRPLFRPLRNTKLPTILSDKEMEQQIKSLPVRRYEFRGKFEHVPLTGMQCAYKPIPVFEEVEG